MARRPRMEYAGAVYHVMDRGDRREDIFVDAEDRRRFLRTLGQACERAGWRVHSFVLMRNHYHLLLETPEPNLSRGMHWLQTTYTVRHNRRHELHGHLFQGRYKAIIVEAEADDYFTTVSSYIHLNPVRARLLRAGQSLGDYAWSSFPAIWGEVRNRPEWLEAARVLGAYGMRDTAGGRRRYRSMMEQRAISESKSPLAASAEWKSVREAWAIGSEDFRRHLREQFAAPERTTEDGACAPLHDEEEAAQLIARGLELLRPGDLRSLPKNHAAKVALAAFVKRRTTVTNRWLAEHLDMGSHSHVSRQCQGVTDRPEAAHLLRLLQKSKVKA
jgi:putative transposase